MTESNLYEEIIIAGFGGQGIIFTGKLLAQTAMESGREVTSMPSYGAEVRGGTANCMVIISDEAIGSPVIDKPSSLIVMNKASLAKFAAKIRPGGLLVFNSSLIDTKPDVPDSVELLAVPADKIAVELGNIKVANMVALGAYLQKKGILRLEDAVKSLPRVLAERYHKTLPVNIEAIKRGGELVTATIQHSNF